MLAHILVCFLAYVLWKTLSQWMRRSGLGEAPRTLIEELAKSYASGKQVKLSLQIADLEMNTDTALPLGLIVNEVVSNSYKHAFAMVDQPRLEVVLELERQLLFY